MESDRHKFDEDFTAISKRECIYRNGRRISASPSPLIPIVNLQISPNLIEDALEKVAIRVSRVKCEETLDVFADRPVSEERLASRIWPALSRASARLEDRNDDHFASIMAYVKDTSV